MKVKPAVMLMATTSVFLSACHTAQVDDLEEFITALQSNPAPAPALRAELPEITQLLTQVHYHGEQYRSPFEANLTQLERDSNQRLACEPPDLTLRHHLL